MRVRIDFISARPAPMLGTVLRVDEGGKRVKVRWDSGSVSWSPIRIVKEAK
jgi:hypothetical protein